LRSSQRAILIILVLTFCAGCGSTFRSDFLKEASNKGWSEKQRKAASADAYTYFLTTLAENKDKSQELLADTKNVTTTVALPTIKYSLLGLDRLVERIDQWLEDFDLLLGYKLPEEVKYVDIFGLRPSLAYDEKVMMAVRARVKAAELDINFKALLGQIPAEFAKIDHLTGYSIRRIFGAKNPLDTFKFNVDQIDEARKSGSLKQIENYRLQVDRKFDHKDQDPNNPEDQNAYIWFASKQDIEIFNYKILSNEKPKDNVGNYIEGFRWVNGKKESRPCLKVFMLSGEDSDSVMVIDTKKEGEPGFGLPDFVEKKDDPVSAKDLIHDEDLIQRLFESRKENKRVPPKNVPIYVEIARAENLIDVWETSTDKVKGFVVPFSYKNKIGSNYNIRIELSRPNIEVTTSESAEPNMSAVFKYIKKEWTDGTRFKSSMGDVVEYYKAKAPYDTMKLLSARVLVSERPESTKRILLIKEDGSTENGFVKPGINKYTDDKPVAVMYTEGERRYVIRRTPGSSVFNKKMELSTEVSEDTGVYVDSNESEYGPAVDRSKVQHFDF
jgi:hypothetical protein